MIGQGSAPGKWRNSRNRRSPNLVLLFSSKNVRSVKVTLTPESAIKDVGRRYPLFLKRPRKTKHHSILLSSPYLLSGAYLSLRGCVNLASWQPGEFYSTSWRQICTPEYGVKGWSKSPFTSCKFVQTWYKSRRLGCGNLPPAAWGSQEAGFTQPSLYLLFHVCTRQMVGLELWWHENPLKNCQSNLNFI